MLIEIASVVTKMPDNLNVSVQPRSIIDESPDPYPPLLFSTDHPPANKQNEPSDASDSESAGTSYYSASSGPGLESGSESGRSYYSASSGPGSESGSESGPSYSGSYSGPSDSPSSGYRADKSSESPYSLAGSDSPSSGYREDKSSESPYSPAGSDFSRGSGYRADSGTDSDSDSDSPKVGNAPANAEKSWPEAYRVPPHIDALNRAASSRWSRRQIWHSPSCSRSKSRSSLAHKWLTGDKAEFERRGGSHSSSGTPARGKCLGREQRIARELERSRMGNGKVENPS